MSAENGWITRAACRPGQVEDPDWFFPEGTHPEQWPGTEAALKLCASCPVAVQCLSWALDHPRLSAHGIWAGTGPAQRHALRAARQGQRGQSADACRTRSPRGGPVLASAVRVDVRPVGGEDSPIPQGDPVRPDVAGAFAATHAGA